MEAFVGYVAGPMLITGREAELRRVEELAGAIGDGPAAVLIEGEVGIGKTTLWKEGVAAATSRSHRVLVCRPVESETQLPYAALGDLLADVPDAALAGLPEPQRRAVEVALLRAEPEGLESPRRAVAVGTLGVLSALARERPTLVAIDDVQWLDNASESALAFAVRRLKDERIGVLVARRLDGAEGPVGSVGSLDGAPLGLDRAFPDERLGRLRLGSLSAAALDRVLLGRLGAALPRQALARIHRASGGNPFVALEIGRALLDRREPDRYTADLPIPARLRELVRDRLALLPGPALEVMRIAAALSRPTTALLDAAMNSQGATAAVDAAVRAGVVELDGQHLRFTHPLLASVAYAQVPAAGKRDIHRRLAAILDDPEERARHLALAAELPDAGVAAALDDAARRAWARGAPDAAAELSEWARRLTPAGARDAARRRGIDAAERSFEAGQLQRARTLLEEIVAEPDRGGRMRALARLGWIRLHTEGTYAGAELFAAALAEPTDDVALRVEIEEGLAWCLHSTSGLADAEAHARAALDLAEGLGDTSILAGALSHVAFLSSLAGRGIAMATIERALELECRPGWPQILGRPDWIHAILLQWDDRLGAARQRLGTLYREEVERGGEHSLHVILFQLARVELLLGEWESARRHAEVCHEATVQSGQAGELPYSILIQALVDAHAGELDRARARIAEGLPMARRLGTRPAELELLATRGFVELSAGDVAEADRILDRIAAAVEATGLREPGVFRFHGDAIEAKVALGRTDEARALIDQLDELDPGHERPWVRTVASRGRGLLSAALGDLDAAYEALDRALDAGDRLGQPFEHARTLLVLGSVQRRDRKKRTARDSLGRALETFDRLGAAAWSAKASAELARIGGRAPAAGLTPTEERVAALIAAGRTYQEAANELFISPRTVQWNLSKIYRKLGIRSRAELAVRLPPAQRPSGGDGDSTPAEPPVPR